MTERFDDYMERCLYHPAEGFYSSAVGVAGRRGDFITSPEVGPLFGAVLARAIDRWWDEAGQPTSFTVVDLGTGPGTLLRAIEAARPRCADSLTLIGIDRAGSGKLADDLSDSIVVANELLDNVPFRQMRRGPDGWQELHVDDGRPVWHPADEDPPLAVAGVDGGEEVPVLSGAAALVADVLARGAQRLVAFDYGLHTTAALVERGGWLRTYRTHERGADPFFEPGLWDITTDIAVDQLPSPDRVVTQAEFLDEHGIGELVEEGKRYWTEHAARPDLQAMRMRSRVSEAEALRDPDGLGSWLCLEWVDADGRS